jgi:hypothetical protein
MERYARYQNLPFPISRRPQLTRYPDKTKAYLPLKVKLPLSPVPQRGPYRESETERERERERESPLPEPVVYSFTHISQSCKLRNRWKTSSHRPRRLTWTEGLHTMGCGLVPQGDRLRHCYYHPRAMQPSARYIPSTLGWVDQCPVSQSAS